MDWQLLTVLTNTLVYAICYIWIIFTAIKRQHPLLIVLAVMGALLSYLSVTGNERLANSVAAPYVILLTYLLTTNHYLKKRSSK